MYEDTPKEPLKKLPKDLSKDLPKDRRDPVS
jgi:hypothetical protein